MRASDLLREAKQTLVAANERFGWQGDEAEQARDLLVHVMGRESDDDEAIPGTVRRRFDKLVKRRTTGEPMAFILGWVDFLDFRMEVRPGAFVPRLTSEFLATQAIRRLRARREPVHIDLATGIGPVAISSARAVPRADVFGADISRNALAQARVNAKKLSARNVTFVESDLFSGLSSRLRGQADVVTIHPPYVPRDEIVDLPVEIKQFEPEHTLTDKSSDGLGLARRVIDEAPDWMCDGGWLLIEIVPTESRIIRSMLKDGGFRDVRSTHGSLKLTRVICGRA